VVRERLYRVRLRQFYVTAQEASRLDSSSVICPIVKARTYSFGDSNGSYPTKTDFSHAVVTSPSSLMVCQSHNLVS